MANARKDARGEEESRKASKIKTILCLNGYFGWIGPRITAKNDCFRLSELPLFVCANNEAGEGRERSGAEIVAFEVNTGVSERVVKLSRCPFGQ